ncbi:acid phosphatase/Vanadium-dependent haloperoxidase [Terfezia boudieri ATCC MYA-4762]|uniref:Acid phosphatase/Vanadium-dependent haloperoxidase n=1 Tax=Terfezia boudieri ATCC MYA-4762 TaxID=1051890 RepID=A0A3N4LYL4_9PEZI|nr:acid phosphatase/Vanadium-dependent haloperoxidase [Terfezia boudieri ATCC MYA-4762]
MVEEFLLERLELSREEEGLLDYDGDELLLESGRFRKINRNTMRGSSRMARITVFAEAVRLLDWIVILIIFTIASTLGSWILPTTRPFPLPSYLFPSSSSSSSLKINDTTISLVSGVPTMFPYLNGSSTVPFSIVMIVSLAVPFLLILFFMVFAARLPLPPNHGRANISKASTYRLRLRLANTYILGLLFSLALTLFATGLLKNVIGKQRPDFWGRCGGVIQDEEIVSKYTIPDYGLSTSTGGGTRMVTWEVCQNYYSGVIVKPATSGSGLKIVSRGTLQDGWRSFPSGHASISFAGLGYLSLFIAYACGALGSRREVRVGKGGKRSILALVATVVPVLVAGYISATRYADLMHWGADICAGIVLGVMGVAVGWGWYAVEAQTILDGGLLGEEEEKEEVMKGELSVEEMLKPGAEVVPVVVRVESADDIRLAR